MQRRVTAMVGLGVLAAAFATDTARADVAAAPGADSSAEITAAGFDAATGMLRVDDAAWSVTFDDATSIERLDVVAYDVFTQQELDASALVARLERGDDAIEGSGWLALGEDAGYVSIRAFGQLTELIGHRVEVTLWQRARGTRMTPQLSWQGGDPLSPTQLGSITLQPTGVVTEDGWEQWTTGPVDFAWGESVPPSDLQFVDEAITAAFAGGALPTPGARAQIDGLAVRDLGEALVAADACALPTESETCGARGVCHLGRCVDAAIRLGQPLLDDTLRADYVDRRLFEVERFEGGRAPRAKLDAVAAALVPLKAAPRADFWSTFTQAYDLLVDGHARAPLVAYPAFQNAGVCVHEGEANLLPGLTGDAAVMPLVFQTGASVVGVQLEPGDALVRIDGLPTKEWAAAAGRLIGHPGDPVGRSVVTAPQIMAAAVDSGAVLTFQRCALDQSAGITPCGAGDVQEVVVDLGALLGDPVVAGQSALTYDDIATCDYRFVRPVAGNDTGDNTDYQFTGFSDDGGVRTLVINGVPSQYGRGGDAWFDGIATALEDAPPALILDERTGDGGGVDALDWIGSQLLAPADMLQMDFLPSFEHDELGPARTEVVECSDEAGQNALGCGNGFRWRVGDVGDRKHGVAATTKLAVIIAKDVSGNDYLTRMLKARGTSTRVFGAGSTWGAYGVIWPMAAHLGELSGGSMQVQDTIFMKDASDDNVAFATSTGERPDQVVRQTMSDARLGKDTVLEAARAWLLEQP